MGSGSWLLAQITGPAKDKQAREAEASTRNVAAPRSKSFLVFLETTRTAPGIARSRKPARAPATFRRISPQQRTQIMRAIKPIERLVPVSSTRRRAYTSGLSTWSSSTALIGSTRFEVGFPLRCLQRLSRPYIATLHCGWRHNSSTRGTSIPVLSY
jgi:hypothetical protein